jgi:flagellar basal-body rod protein FlgG
MYAQQLNLDVISNNLANVNTTAFKKSRAEFQDLIYQVLQTPGAPVTSGGDLQVPVGMQVGLGVKPAAIGKIFSSDAFQETENPLDLAIEGDGFFQVTLPDGRTAYTRDGSFKLTAEGRIVTANGYYLSPEITLPADTTEISISEAGVVSVLTAGSTATTQVGQLELAKFPNPSGLRSYGKNLYLESDASGAPVVDVPGTQGIGNVVQGVLEMSNVKVVEEMVKMIIAQRAYEANSKSVSSADDMLAIANSMVRR